MTDNGKITLDLLHGHQTVHFEELAVSAYKVRHARANEDFINVVGANLRQFRACTTPNLKNCHCELSQKFSTCFQ